MTNIEIDIESFEHAYKTVETQTDMTYWRMSDLAYSYIEKLTGGEIATPEELKSKSYSTEVVATYDGEAFVRQTTTYAAPNVYGMLPENIQEQVDQGEFRDNTINYTDKRDTFGTLNDRYPQIGEQMYVDNKQIWMGNHSLEKFEDKDEIVANWLDF